MPEIKCPNCGSVFTVDESGYASILAQVRNAEFEKELLSREKSLEEKKESDLQVIRLEEKERYDKLLAVKVDEISERDMRIKDLEGKLSSAKSEKELAVSEAVKELEKKLSAAKSEQELAVNKAVSEAVKELEKKLNAAEAEQKLAVSNAEKAKDEELSKKNILIEQLNGEITHLKETSAHKETLLKDQYKSALALKDEQIAELKDFKVKLSTKMVGESLEQHCLSEFNKIRMTAFPNAKFEKDNDAKSGSKGDFIFKEKVDDVELISIMFEMKNESDTPGKKHKNEDFFKKLDKDRTQKECEYAVLVSMLEPESELYNSGIVDVSYDNRKKMYVIRPQFFIPMITLLRNAALNSLKYKKRAIEAETAQVDISTFEGRLDKFKKDFAKKYDSADKNYDKAINRIEKLIASLNTLKDELTLAQDAFRRANNAAEDLTIKKLTRGRPSLLKKFEELQDVKKAAETAAKSDAAYQESAAVPTSDLGSVSNYSQASQ